MKIAFFHNLPEGGAKRVVFEQVKYLSKKHKVSVFEIAQDDNKFQDLKKISTVKTYKFNIKNNLPGFLNRVYSDYKNFYSLSVLHKQIADEIDRGKFDLVIAHPDKYTQAPFLLRYLKTRSIYFCEEVLRIAYEKELEFNEDVLFIKKWYENVTRGIRKNIDKKNALSAGLILANSKYTSENIKKAYNKGSEVFLLGVDSNLFKLRDVKKTVDVLYIGELEDIEGFDLLKEVMSEGKIKVKVLCRKNRKFNLTDNDLVNEYNSSRIVVALNRNEPFGLIPLEAMSCGVPVVAVAEGGFKETIRDGATGYLVKRDGAELLIKINKLLDDHNLYEQMSAKCRDDIVHNWDWKIRMKEFEKFLKI
jgi:glycosyltransferase involved in cell wall biosynthesis